MSPVARTLTFVSLASLVGCSLFTSLDDLQGGGPDGDVDASDAGTTGDAPFDTSSIPDAQVDANVDAGSWAFVASNGVTVNASTLTIDSATNVRKGDLVVLACDASSGAQALGLSGFDVMTLPLQTVGPETDGLDYEAQIMWGVATADISPSLTITVTSAKTSSFIDCTLNVYRGGAPNVTKVAEVKSIGPRDSGLATCGPITTAPGGVAVYVSARTACVGAPVGDTFVQRQGINGNASGDAVPTDGGTIGTTLADCMGSKEDWICLTVSLTP